MNWRNKRHRNNSIMFPSTSSISCRGQLSRCAIYRVGMQLSSWIFYKETRCPRNAEEQGIGDSLGRVTLRVGKKVSGISGTATFPTRRLGSCLGFGTVAVTHPFSIFARHVFTRWVFISLTAAFIIMNFPGVRFGRRFKCADHPRSRLFPRDSPGTLIRKRHRQLSPFPFANHKPQFSINA